MHDHTKETKLRQDTHASLVDAAQRAPMTQSRVDRILELIERTPAPKVKPIHTRQGCFVNRALQKATKKFVGRAKKPRDKRPRP